VIAAGFYSFWFPMPAWFSWNCTLATASAVELARQQHSLKREVAAS
jgi:hypothetical protein